MSDFKLGDRVETINNVFKIPKGSRGTIKHISPSAYIGIEFDENIWKLYRYGHNCDGLAKQGHGYYIQPDDLELINTTEPKIRWYSKGRFTKWENK